VAQVGGAAADDALGHDRAQLGPARRGVERNLAAEETPTAPMRRSSTSSRRDSQAIAESRSSSSIQGTLVDRPPLSPWPRRSTASTP
jgi:hypothetical protein